MVNVGCGLTADFARCIIYLGEFSIGQPVSPSATQVELTLVSLYDVALATLYHTWS